MTEFIIIWLAALVLVMAVDNAMAEPYPMETVVTIPVTADVTEIGSEQPIDAAPTIDGVSISDWRAMPAEGYATIEPAGGEEKEGDE